MSNNYFVNNNLPPPPAQLLFHRAFKFFPYLYISELLSCISLVVPATQNSCADCISKKISKFYILVRRGGNSPQLGCVIRGFRCLEYLAPFRRPRISMKDVFCRRTLMCLSFELARMAAAPS